MPFESLTTIQAMMDKTTCPEPSEFASKLYGTERLTDEEMAEFRSVWNTCNVRNLHQLFTWYNVLDTCQMADAAAFFFDKLHRICSLHPLHFYTLSGLAMSAMLYNCSAPENKSKKLFLPFLTAEVYNFFDSNLSGGYSSNQGWWALFNNGFVYTPPTKKEREEPNLSKGGEGDDPPAERAEKEANPPRKENHDVDDNDDDLLTEGQFHDENGLYAG